VLDVGNFIAERALQEHREHFLPKRSDACLEEKYWTGRHNRDDCPALCQKLAQPILCFDSGRFCSWILSLAVWGKWRPLPPVDSTQANALPFSLSRRSHRRNPVQPWPESQGLRCQSSCCGPFGLCGAWCPTSGGVAMLLGGKAHVSVISC
jgi:hypothetical protein